MINASNSENASQRILLTGASGFIASHIAQQLLSAGYTVIGTVRDPQNDEKVAHLKALEGAAERLEVVAANLMDDDPFSKYSDVDYIIHTASPYALDMDDPQKDLVDPAVHGTLSLLRAASTSARVKRVVITSSLAAVTDSPDKTKVLTEADWNTKSSLKRNPYYYSKMQAEKAAWKYMEDNDFDWDLVVVNPYMTIGPSLGPGLNNSNALLKNVALGGMPGILDLHWGFVDVRDVAKAHILAMETPQANGRYLCVAGKRSMREVVEFCRTNNIETKTLPTKNMEGAIGSFMTKVFSRFQPAGTGSYLRTHIGKSANIATEKIKTDLGMTFRDVDETLAAAYKGIFQG